MALQALIVEDEPAASAQLASLLSDHLPQIEVCGICSAAAPARQLLTEQPVDLVFLDVHLPGESGFDLLDSLPNRPFHLVFVTGFDHYAIRAIRTQALDYLLKPVDRHVLQATVNRVFERGEPSAAIAPIRPFSHKPESLTLYHAGGFDLVPFVDILYLKGEDNYTRFQLADGHSILVTRTLKEFEELLAPEGFLRIHKSSVINPRWIKSYRFENTGHVRMKNGEDLEVSRRRSKLLFEVIDRLSIGTKRSTRSRS